MTKSVTDLASRWLRRGPEALSAQEHRVLQSAVERKPVSRDLNAAMAGQEALGDRLADSIARVGGSWTFIISFIVFLVFWTVGNSWLLGREGFDPYPFIFLNLVLSMIAALQAPVPMSCNSVFGSTSPRSIRRARASTVGMATSDPSSRRIRKRGSERELIVGARPRGGKPPRARPSKTSPNGRIEDAWVAAKGDAGRERSRSRGGVAPSGLAYSRKPSMEKVSYWKGLSEPCVGEP
jgi:hypothetical protein